MRATDILKPELLIDLPCRTGEGPLWHPDEQRIYWTDIPNGRLYRCSADGRELETFEVGAPVGGFTLQEDGALLLFMARGAIRTWRDGTFTGTLIAEIPEERESRFNDVIADPRGRVFCGTMSTPSRCGSLYRLDTNGELTLVVAGMQTPNGMGFSPDRRYFYQNDSGVGKMYRYRYDEPTGAISERETIITVEMNGVEGRPDGMTVDAEGMLWTGRWDGWRATRHTPDGTKVADYLFPVKKISSLTFGGSDMRTGFFTTAGGHDRAENGACAGALFTCAMPVQGLPEFRSRI